MRDAPPRTQGYFLLLVQEKVAKEKDTPDGANTPAHPRFRDPALPLREIHLALGRRRHPVCAPFGALARNLAVRGRAIRGPKQSTHLRPVLLVPFGVRRALGARFKLIADR